jgi:hypothetical protein
MAGVATGGTVAVAGCSGIPLIGGSPEAAVEQYFTAARNADVESANEVLHPESSQYPLEQGDLENVGDLTVNDVNQVSAREIVEWEVEQYDGSGNEPSEEEIEQQVGDYEERSEEIANELGVDDHTWVLVSYVQDGEEREDPINTVQDDGEWYILV